MKVLVIGAGGRTGRLVVSEAVRAGHQATAFVQKPDQFEAGVELRVGDAADSAAVDAAVAGQDAVIDTIGGKAPYKDTDLETSTARVLVESMQRHGVRRLVVVSALGVNESEEQAPFWYEYLLIPTMLRGVVKDKAGMEQAVSGAHLDYVLVRPALLSEDDDAPPLRVITGDEKVRKTVRKDLAQFLVQQVGSDRYLRSAVVVANA